MDYVVIVGCMTIAWKIRLPELRFVVNRYLIERKADIRCQILYCRGPQSRVVVSNGVLRKT